MDILNDDTRDGNSLQNLLDALEEIGCTTSESRLAYRLSVDRDGSINHEHGILVGTRLIAARGINPDTYRASLTRGKRRTAEDIERLKTAMFGVVMKRKPTTVRHVFYAMVSMGLIAKTEADYNNVVCRLLAQMRKDRQMPFDWIADNTRWMRIPRTNSSLTEALQQTQQFYRRDIWDNQDAYVEVWLEKEALAGVLVDVTHEWHVPLMVTRGYPSLTFLHSAAENLEDDSRDIHIYYFGDHDPSGVDISRNVREALIEYSGRDDITFERVAVTPEQIKEMNLPTRPTKKSDTRSKGFEGGSVEVDAIPPDTLREMCQDCIVQHIDDDRLESLRIAEQAERETLKQIAYVYGDE